MDDDAIRSEPTRFAVYHVVHFYPFVRYLDGLNLLSPAVRGRAATLAFIGRRNDGFGLLLFHRVHEPDFGAKQGYVLLHNSDVHAGVIDSDPAPYAEQ